MTNESNTGRWTITCQCKTTVLQAQGTPIHVAICHCADCRTAQGGSSATETLALMRRDQVESTLEGLQVVPADAYNDQVPRYFCATCNSCLVGDCTPVGFDMVIVPTARMSADANIGQPDYHMHLGEGIVNPASDGLPHYHSQPEGPHMAQLLEGCA